MPNCARVPKSSEFMPEDYFCRHRSQDIFGNGNLLEVDLGCGDGTFLTQMASRYPERNFLGVERLLGRLSGVCRKIKELGLTNARVLRLESLYTVEWLLEGNSVSRLHLLFPDPWPKMRHHKRRLVQKPFLTALQKVLEPGGEFIFKTDHPDYYQWVCEQVEDFGKLTALPWHDASEDASFFYPKTDFEKLWEKQGKKIHRLRFQNK